MERNNKKNYLLYYVGGKFRIASWIIAHFIRHKIYVEVFGGAGHILLQKTESYLEVYNDINGDLVNLYKIILDNPEKFFERALYLPYARKLYYDWVKEWKEGKKGKNDFERALRYFSLSGMSFSGKFGTNWGYSKSSKSKGITFQNRIKRIPYFVRRFQNVQIENLDFEDCIKRYDSPETLFYCDPPYILDKNYYQKEKFDHKRLAKVLNGIKGFAILSYYPHEDLKKWYGKWYVDFKKVNTTVSKIEKGKKQKEAYEIL